jgi:hypothetical protein
VTGIGNADALGVSTVMTTIAPAASVLVLRRIKGLVNESDIMGSDFQWWRMGNRIGQEGGDDLERGEVVDEYFVGEKRLTRYAQAL